MAYATSIVEVIALFGVLSFFTASAATPLSLLVMETIEKRLWAQGFSKLQMLGSIGGALGLLVASVVTGFLPLRILMLILIPFTIASLIIAFAIREPQKALERREIIKNRLALRVRLMMHSLLFIRLPSPHFIKSVFAPRGAKRMQDLTLIYIALFAFYLGSGYSTLRMCLGSGGSAYSISMYLRLYSEATPCRLWRSTSQEGIPRQEGSTGP
jgi:hypothetical protein